MYFAHRSGVGLIFTLGGNSTGGAPVMNKSKIEAEDKSHINALVALEFEM